MGRFSAKPCPQQPGLSPRTHSHLQEVGCEHGEATRHPVTEVHSASRRPKGRKEGAGLNRDQKH